MGGICGFIGDPSGVDTGAMMVALAHRGSDAAEQTAHDPEAGTAWLGIRGLASSALRGGTDEPATDASGRLTLVCDGGVYNHPDIRSELASLGAVFRGHSSMEVLVEAWSRWGVAALGRFRGMYALAVWDREERALYLARDRLGEKPLYYAADRGRVLFASEVRALLASGVLARKLSSDGLDAYLSFGAAGDPYTLVDGVYALGPGCWAKTGDGRVDVHRYWSVRAIGPGAEFPTKEEAVSQTAGRLRASVAQLLAADLDVGVLLSGGIHSSSIVGLLTELGFDGWRSLSVAYDRLHGVSEYRRWCEVVSQRLGPRHTFVFVEDSELRRWLREAIGAMDQPSRGGIHTFIQCRALAEAGIRVGMSGLGADEIFIGDRQRKMLRYWAIAEVSTRLFGGRGDRVRRQPWIVDSRFGRLLELALQDARAGAVAFLMQHAVFTQGGIERLRGERRPPQARFVEPLGAYFPSSRLARLELGVHLRNTLLRDADQMSMANGVELRKPYLDHRIAEYVLALPPSYLVKRGRTEPLLLEALGSALRLDLAARSRVVFQPPVGSRLKRGLRIADNPGADLGLDPRAVAAEEEGLRRGVHWSRYWTLQVLSAWCRRHGVSG